MGKPPFEKSESDRYRQRKTGFDRCLTIYGRNTVHEALLAPGLVCERLHFAASNQPSPILDEIRSLAQAMGADIQLHAKTELSRISRAGREDQGVAADVRWSGYQSLDEWLKTPAPDSASLLAVDGISNPQNLGMLVRSVTAGSCAGILIPRRGCCDISPLVIKSSAGTVFRSRILRCDSLSQGLRDLRDRGWKIVTLEATATTSLFAQRGSGKRVFVLGNESTGPSVDVRALADYSVSIPMNNGVESLNVAVAAALIAFHNQIAG